VLDLVEQFPAAAELMREAEAAPPSRTHDGFSISSARRGSHGDGQWTEAAAGLTVEIEDGAQRMRVSTERGGAFGVRRTGPRPAAMHVERDALVVRGDTGAVDAAVFARARGVEELFWIREPRARVGYELDLPAGWTLKQPQGWPGLVEIRDGRGRPRARLVADKAWDATGAKVAIDTRVEGNSVLFAATAGATSDVLIDPEWQATATLIQIRMRATATLLPSGKVLVVGGEASIEGEVLCSSELYDPLDGSFEAGPLLPGPDGEACAPLMDHVAVPLPSGEVLIAGGANRDAEFHAKAIASAWLYDARTSTFTAIDPMSEARVHHTATTLPDGTIFVAGGASRPSALHEKEGTACPTEPKQPCKCLGLSSAEIYHPESRSFTKVAGAMPARACHTATLLSNGGVLLVGGGDEDGNDVGPVTLFADGAFVELGTTLLQPRHGHVAALIPDAPGSAPSKLLVAFGLSGKRAIDPGNTGAGDPPAPEEHVVAEMLDTSDLSNTFAQVSVPACDVEPVGCVIGRGYPAATILPSGHVLVAGGQQQHSADTLVASPVADVFDPSTEMFSSVGPLLSPVRKPVLTPLPTGKILLLGQTAPIQVYDDLQLVEGSGSPDMVAQRADFTATPLLDGNVLVAGGRSINGVHDSAELFHPDTGSQDLIPLAEKRFAHTATLLTDGRVLIAGGAPLPAFTDLLVSNTAEVYDPKAKAFTATGSMSARRVDHAATLLADGRVLVTGGYPVLDGSSDENLSSAELYDPATGSWSEAGSMGQARCDHTSTLLPSGRVLIAGGYSAPDTGAPSGHLASAELYDPKTNTFSPIEQSMGDGRGAHTATALPDGRVLLAGGNEANGSAEIFDPEAAVSFQLVGAMSSARFNASAAMLLSGKVLIVSGRGSEVPVASIEVFDPVSLRFTVLPIEQGRGYHQAVLLRDGSVLALGGEVGGVAQGATETTARIREVDTAATARPELAAVPPTVIPGETYRIGGNSLTSTEVTSDTYSSPAAFPIALWMPMAGTPSLGSFAPWSASGAAWMPPAAPYPGPGWLFAVTRGVRSARGASVIVSQAPDGVACDADAACMSGFCRDGVCCDTSCHQPTAAAPDDFVCRACSAAKKGAGEDGVCGPVAAGTDPQNDCTVLNECPEVTGSCNSTGACTLCTSKSCSSDHSLLVTDSNGVSHVEDCGEFRCDTEARECRTRCTSRLDCADGFVCTAGGGCADPAEITSGGCDCAAGAPNQRWAPAALALALLGAAARRRRARVGNRVGAR
jgi:N-acetylneuraminic acid mutarotase